MEEKSIVHDKEAVGNTQGQKWELGQIVEPLLQWYDSGHRILPWRENPVPYFVWVSEIMLQQTRVEAVKPYFQRFLEALPDIISLAEAEEEVLLKLWEGLGYYNRVRNMKKAAEVIVKDYHGEMPAEYDQIITLPGIGSYTAGAIASIAFGQKVPAVDGNVLRVVSRLKTDNADIGNLRVKKELEIELEEAMPPDRPGDFNQAMMELGATVCVPNGMAKCDICPLEKLCKARNDNCVMDFPKKASKKARVIENKTVLIIRDENRTALRKRPAKGLLAGMYEFPSLEGHQLAEQVLSYLKETGVNPIRIQPLEDSKHIFSHKEWHMKAYVIRVDELEPLNNLGGKEKFLFVEPEETQNKYPIPTAFIAYSKYLNIKTGNKKFIKEER